MRNLENKKLAKDTTSRLKNNFPSGHPGQVYFLAGQFKSEFAGRTGHFDKEISFSKSFC